MPPARPLPLPPLEPFAVAWAGSAAANALPAEIEGQPLRRLDPTQLASAAFLRRVHALDERAYGPRGLAMPRWVFYDCAIMPGGVFGFAHPAAPGEVAEPAAACTLVPMLEPGAWLLLGLSSADDDVALEALTVAWALRLLGVKELWGVTQWGSPALLRHARLAPLTLVTAHTPAHGEPRSLTWRRAIDDEVVGRATRTPPPPPPTAPAPTDDAALRALQARLEGGARVALLAADEEGRTWLREEAP